MARISDKTKEVFAEKLKTLRLRYHLNQPQLAAKLDVTKNAVSNWEAGRAFPTLEILSRLCAVLNTSADELMGLPPKAFSGEELNHLMLYRQLSKYDRESVDGLIQSILHNDEVAFREACATQFERLSYAALPASAGTGMPLDGIAEADYVYVRVSRESCMADEIISVSGDSMMPTFRDGDMLLVEHTTSVDPGDIGVFVCAGEGYVKEYQKDGLHSHNPKYKTIRPSEDDNVRCIGRVLGAIGEDQLATEKEQRVLDELYAQKRRAGKR